MSGKKGFVHVYVRGHYSGADEFDSVELAEKDAAERRALSGLAVGYIVTDGPVEPDPWA